MHFVHSHIFTQDKKCIFRVKNFHANIYKSDKIPYVGSHKLLEGLIRKLIVYIANIFYL